MEISLSLSGGAARGAYHLGVLHCLDELHIEIKALCGVSIGAIIGASYTSGIKPKKQLEIFQSKEFRDIFSFNWFRGSLFDVNHAANILQELIPKKNIEDLSIPMWISALDITHAESFLFERGNIKEICLASSALTPLFKPVRYGDSMFADGGFINNLVVDPLQNFPHKIVGVNLHPFDRNFHKNGFFSYLKRVAFISNFSEVLQSEKRCDIVIESLKIREFSIFSFSNLEAMFVLGYEDAKRIFALQNL
ncbi:MAG: patatin-like phospholipase family protein [Campylobacterales bacterium]|nr:patatin-like phospholipase family protein [Campylobacterales bacterium]